MKSRHLILVFIFTIPAYPAGDDSTRHERDMANPVWKNVVELSPPGAEGKKHYIIDQPFALDSSWGFELPVQKDIVPGPFTLVLTGHDGTFRHEEVRAMELSEQGKILRVDLTGVDSLQMLYRMCKSPFQTIPAQVAITSQGRTLGVVRFCLYDPEKPGKFPRCEVKRIGGANVPVIEGRAEGSLASYLGAYIMENNDRILQDSISDFSEAGIRMFEIKVHDLFPYWLPDGSFDTEGFYQHIERHVVRIVSSCPSSHYMICWYLYVPEWWLTKYPDEVIRLDDGSEYLLNTPGHRLQASYASEHWREQMGSILEKAIYRIKDSPIADRFAGIQLAYGNCGEWNNWGYHEETFPDYSPVMQRAFGQWLKAKYKTENKLKTAWGDDAVTFDGEVVPARSQRMGDSVGVFRRMPAAQRVVDFYTFWQEYTIETIEYFAKIVKRVTDGHCLAGSYYGYYVGHHGRDPYHYQDCGHFGLGKFLASDCLDFSAGPYPYEDRRRNCAINGVFRSFRLSKKFWFSENDQRTHYSGGDNIGYGTTDTLEESIAIARRDFLINLTKGSSYYFYDFLRGWYRDVPFMSAVKRLKEIDTFALEEGRESIAQVAMFVSEYAIPFLSNHNSSITLPWKEMILWEMDAGGAPWDLFLLSDLSKVDLSPYKLVLLPNAFAVTPLEKEDILHRLRGGGRTVVFFYAPGLMGEKGFDAGEAAELAGIRIAMDESSCLNKLTSNILGFTDSLVYENAIQPLVYAEDSEAIPLGYVNETGQVGIAEKRFKDHTVLYLSAPSLNQRWLRMLYDRSGVHVYSRTTNDMFYAAGPFAGLYSRSGGEKKLCWPGKKEIIYDLIEKKILAENTDHVTFSLPEHPETIVIYAGPKIHIP